MDAIPEVLNELRAGRMVVLVDDEQRENEGDLVCPAEHVTPETVNFMLREARGLLCLALSGEQCDRLELAPQSAANTTQRGTAFTVTVDAHERFGITTGVSAADRARTIRVAADPATQPGDLARPGHVSPLRARDGGVLVRAGQTEGSVDLARLAGLEPAAAIIEIMNADGTMARMPELERFSERHGLRLTSVADLIEYRLRGEKLVERVEEAPFECAAGRFRLIAYQSAVDPMPHVALVTGEIGRRDELGQPVERDDPVLVRMHSQNLLGDVFGDTTQPTRNTLEQAMHRIQREGEGAIVYLRHEGMGTGLLQRLQTRARDEDGSQADRPAIGSAQPTPGVRPPADKGAYGIGSQILRDLGIQRLRLLTNHPFVPTALSGFGLEIDGFEPV